MSANRVSVVATWHRNRRKPVFRFPYRLGYRSRFDHQPLGLEKRRLVIRQPSNLETPSIYAAALIMSRLPTSDLQTG